MIEASNRIDLPQVPGSEIRIYQYICPLYVDRPNMSPCRFTVEVDGVHMDPVDGETFVPTTSTLVAAVASQNCDAGQFLYNYLASSDQFREGEGAVSTLLQNQENCNPVIARKRRR